MYIARFRKLENYLLVLYNFLSLCSLQAIESFAAERIGHGYRVLEDENIYQKCLRENIHFEVCPHSSYMTGAIKNLMTPSKRHPILRFVVVSEWLLRFKD